jgi:hypothetical protein
MYACTAVANTVLSVWQNDVGELVSCLVLGEPVVGEFFGFLLGELVMGDFVGEADGVLVESIHLNECSFRRT